MGVTPQQEIVPDGKVAAWIGLIGFNILTIVAAYRLYIQCSSLYKLYYKKSSRPLLVRTNAVIPSGTKLRVLFHVLMLLSFGLELPQYFAWATLSKIKIDVQTNKTLTTLANNQHPLDRQSKKMNLFHPNKDYWIELYPFHMFTFVTFFTAFTIVINEWHNVAKPVESSGDERIRQIRERCFWKFLMISVNVVVIVGMLVTIVLLEEDIEEGSKFQENTFYKVFMVCIMITQMMLAFMATIFGLSLMNRIQSVAGYQQSMSAQFKAMMCRLVLIMSICFVCFSARVLVIAFNTFLQHWGTGPNTSVFLLFLALDSWIPVWIPGSALLYLMRQTPEQRFRSSRPAHHPRYNGTGNSEGGYDMDDDDTLDEYSNDSGVGRSAVRDVVNNKMMKQRYDDDGF